MYNYYDLIAICETISGQITTISNLLEHYVPMICGTLLFILFIKVGFTCLRGYKV